MRASTGSGRQRVIEFFKEERNMGSGHERKERTEVACRNTKPSRDGGFSPKIGRLTAERVAKYCRLNNINKTRFVEDCVNKQLDILEDEYYHSLSNEELIAIIKAST